MHAREPASFWRENVVAVVILLRVLAPRKQDRVSNVRSFLILRWGKRVPSFTKDNSANFSSEMCWNKAFQVSPYFENTRKNFTSNLVLVVVLVHESKGLYCHLSLQQTTLVSVPNVCFRALSIRSELTGQTIPAMMRISLWIKTYPARSDKS